MKIAFDMGKQAALARGEDRYGTMVAEIPAAELTEAERAELAHWAEVRNGVVADYDLHRADVGRQFLYAPAAKEPGATGVRALLAWCGVLRMELVGKLALEDAERRTRADAVIGSAFAEARDARKTIRIAYDGAQARQLGQYDSPGPDLMVAVDGPRIPRVDDYTRRDASAPVRDRYDAAVQSAKAEVQRLVEAQRPELERLHAEAKAKAAREAAETEEARARQAASREAGLTAWLEQWATENQRQRQEAGLLPEKEVEQGMADVAFSSVDLPRYDKLTHADTPHGEGCYEPVSAFDAEDACELTAEQWTALQQVRRAAPETAEVRPRVHNARCANCDHGGSATRYGALVVTHRFGRRLVREYALPGGEPE